MHDLSQLFATLNDPYLPYPKSSLAPYISEDTLNYHFEKHHKGYDKNLKNLVEGNAEYKDLDLMTIVLKSYEEENAPIFNNAAQVWNHNFYWFSMKTHGGGEPTQTILSKLIEESFGSFGVFKSAFIDAGKAQFGSGWVWLVYNRTTEKLEVVKTGNAENPLVNDLYPLLTCDVWEHAYYLDYQNRRPDYLEIFMTHLVNWSFAEQRLSTIKKGE